MQLGFAVLKKTIRSGPMLRTVLALSLFRSIRARDLPGKARQNYLEPFPSSTFLLHVTVIFHHLIFELAGHREATCAAQFAVRPLSFGWALAVWMASKSLHAIR